MRSSAGFILLAVQIKTTETTHDLQQSFVLIGEEGVIGNSVEQYTMDIEYQIKTMKF